jgi:putative transposase
VSRLRRMVQSDCYFFVTCNVRKILPRAGQSSRYADPVMLLEDPDFALLADAFETSRKQLKFLLTAWVFMPDHWHAILCPCDPTGISDAMRLIKQRSTYATGLARNQSVRLWQPRFHEHALRTVREYMGAIEYIHLNPVRRNLVAKPEEWKWSSIHDHLPGGTSPLPVDRVNFPSDHNAPL